MIRGINQIELGTGVLWTDPPLVSDCLSYVRENRFSEAINVLEGEALCYTITYSSVRSIFSSKKYTKRSSGRMNGMFWDIYDRRKILHNIDLIKEEDKYLEFS